MNGALPKAYAQEYRLPILDDASQLASSRPSPYKNHAGEHSLAAVDELLLRTIMSASRIQSAQTGFSE